MFANSSHSIFIVPLAVTRAALYGFCVRETRGSVIDHENTTLSSRELSTDAHFMTVHTGPGPNRKTGYQGMNPTTGTPTTTSNSADSILYSEHVGRTLEFDWGLL